MLVERARRAAEKGIEKEVVEAMRAAQQAAGAPPESMAALDKLERGAAVVVTGQQPSAGWGPLYNYYKAQAAMKLAQAIEGRGVPCVAIFWNHSDDSRPGGQVAFPDRENRVREIPVPSVEPGTPLYESGSADALRMFAGALAEALPKTEFAPWLGEFLRGTQTGSVAESFTRSLLGALGRYGLVVLEPRHLEGERSAKFYADHLAAPERLARAVEEGRQAVLAEAFEDHLGRDVGLDVFEIRSGRRTRLESAGSAKGRLSAGVALRPLLQDAVLPTCAYVGGPSEIGYQAELLPAYRAYGIDPPVVYPRVTATILEPKIARLMEKFRMGAADLFAADSALTSRFMETEIDVAGRLSGVPERLRQELESLTASMGTNPAVEKARERTVGKVREAVEALAARIREEQSRQETTGRGQLSKFLAHVRPNGRLQERVFTPFYYASLTGPTFFTKLFPALDPFVFSHQLITLP